ncbi:MAG: VanZ family protein [Flavobacteriaceae bacterium]
MIKLIKKLLGDRPLLFIAIIYTTIITIGSLVNPATLPKIDSNLSDKTIHIIGYCFLTVLWVFYGIIKFRDAGFKKILVTICSLTFLYGIIIEVLQSELTKNRQADLYDILANGMGIFLAVLLLILSQNKIKKLKSNF